MERQSDLIVPPQPIENDDSNIKHQLQLKCNFLEEELGKERLCNQNNVKLVETSAKTIAELKKGIESANARTISKNEELVDKEGKVKEFKKKVDDEILKNEVSQQKILELTDEVTKLTNDNSNNQSGCNHGEELRIIKDRLEKAKEFRETMDLKIKKLKELHLGETSELNIRNIRLKEELSSTVKERQRLKESERILVQTFDTLRMHYEQSRECVQWKQCGL